MKIRMEDFVNDRVETLYKFERWFLNMHMQDAQTYPLEGGDYQKIYNEFKALQRVKFPSLA